MQGDTTHFGYETVPLADKQARVDDVFHGVARRYDLMNDLMSAGLHRAWKSALVSMVRPPRERPYRHLDVAGGTGDVAFRIAEAGGARPASSSPTSTPACWRSGASARRRSVKRASISRR
jgi:demethylmenaquinone methyltransferase/2-methoxy-6-polyprenyl-1,4-benzoquinol methylase